MKKLTTLLAAIALLVSGALQAQVVLSTSTTASPDNSSMLDIQSTSAGILVPRMNQTQRIAIASPATGLLVYQTNGTPGFYYYNGTSWIPIGSDGDDWGLTGNAGTSVATNFIGTTDNVDFATRTNNTERLRVENDGQIVIGNGYTAPYGVDKFTVRGNITNGSAINGYSGVSGGTGIYGEDGGVGFGVYGIAATSGIGVYGASLTTGVGVFGAVNNSAAFGVWADNNNAIGWGLIAAGSNVTPSTLTGRSAGIASNGSDGIFSYGRSSNGFGIIAAGNNGSISTIATGTGGAFTGYHGAYGKGTNSSGTGVIGVGNNNGSYSTLTTGSGGAFRGYHGVYGFSYRGTTTNGTGVIGVGNNLSNYYTYTYGSGGAFTGYRVGVYGYATRTIGNRAGGYFVDNNTYAIVGGYWSGAAYGILSNATKSTVVKDIDDNPVIMYCLEAPEVLFQDYGDGKLVDGKVHISIDPILSKNIHVDESHPIRVFIQLEGDCNGVYVTNKSANGFDVVELKEGTTNVAFTWQIVATRANEEFFQKDGSVEVSDYSRRFPQGPEKLDIVKQQVNTQAIISHDDALKIDESKKLKQKTENID